MAQDTPLSYRNLVLYEVYVRNHGSNGTFADVEADLPRLKNMGVDLVWFMPIHPIGQLNKKGSLGCPYSIQDYSEVNPEYGTKDDFACLISRAHDLNLKVMIDVVFNHTSHDSLLVQQHPNFFHQDAQGRPMTTVPEWSDVIDLKHPNPYLSHYLIETLQMWAEFGVDGFRCDVASLLPQDFWLEARQAVARVKPGVIWLAESVHASFIAHRRSLGLSGWSDSEVYAAFDMCYDYDIWPIFQQAVRGEVPASRYLEMLRFQDAIYPVNFVKMRCVENHDQARIMGLALNQSSALAWTAFEAFNRGAFLIYAGQEAGSNHTPSLFDIDKVDWNHYPLQDFLARLAHLKKDPAQTHGNFLIVVSEPAVQATWQDTSSGLYGVFNVHQESGSVDVPLPDSKYTNLLNDENVIIKSGQMDLPEIAVIFRVGVLSGLKPFYSPLLDYQYPVTDLV